MRFASSLLALNFLLLLSANVRAEDPPAMSPELQVLDHYVGEWDAVMKIPATQQNPKGLEVSGKVTAEWTVGNRWVRQNVDFDPAGGYPGQEVCTMMTYDPEAKKYQFYTFQADGKVNQAVAQWDANRRVMTSLLSTGENAPSVRVDADFSKPGKEDWTISIRDPQGKVVGQITGMNTKK